jgi:hypothetical protein
VERADCRPKERWAAEDHEVPLCYRGIIESHNP